MLVDCPFVVYCLMFVAFLIVACCSLFSLSCLSFVGVDLLVVVARCCALLDVLVA